MLFTISACAGRHAAAPTAAQDQNAAASAEASDAEELARQQAAEEQRLQEEASRRQFAIERNRFIYEDIFFQKNHYRLDEKALRELEWKADWLLAHPEVRVQIEGHCDEGGSAQDNLALGLRRAGR